MEAILKWVLETQMPATLGCVEAWPPSARDRAQSAALAALEHHAKQFEEAGKPAEPRAVAEAVAVGEFAGRPFPGCNLWHDVLLAAGLAGGLDNAAALFRERFEGDTVGWARRFARGDAEAAEDFLGDLLLARERSGPKIESYSGHAPLVAWLKQVFISEADRRRRKRGLVIASPDGANTDGHTQACSIDKFFEPLKI